MGNMFQGLRHVYMVQGHYETLWIDAERKTVLGNPLEGNPDVSRLRKADRVHLTKYGVMTLHARPFTEPIVFNHGETFWY